jgi:hypothetical protein
MEERHSRDGYFIVGEGLVGSTAPKPTGPVIFALNDGDQRPFRFSRVGPEGAQLGEPNRLKIAVRMTRLGDGQVNGSIPAGYTYLGQFLDHDLTFDKSKLAEGISLSPATLEQSRSPSLDLDSLYGLGPDLSPQFYKPDKVRLKTGTTTPVPDLPVTNKAHPGFDLPRKPNGKALIPDPRNDENLVVAQTHSAFIRFHNRVVDTLAAQGVPAADLFSTARKEVVRHYQWMIRHDFLPRIVNPAIVNAVFTSGRKVVEVNPVPGESPTMPVEFSVAAYRLGHSMVRDAYNWNRIFDDGGGTLEFLFIFSGTGGDLGGFPTLPSNWIADFRRLYKFIEAGRADLRPLVGGTSKLNVARRIDTRLVNPLAHLPLSSLPPGETSPHRDNLAFRNLTRARMLRLATGQQMAAFMRSHGVSVPTLTAAQILNGNRGAKLGGPGGLTAAQRTALTRDTPLWFYILREAELNNGRLRGVGGRMVAEVFHRSIEGSLISIMHDPTWRPTLVSPTNPAPGTAPPPPDTFRMVDLLLFAFEGKKALLNPLGG